MELSSPIDIIKKSWKIFFIKENFIFFIKVYALLLPFLIFFAFQNYFFGKDVNVLDMETARLLISSNPWIFGLVVLVNFIFFVVSFVVGIAGIKAVDSVVGQSNLSIKSVFQFSFKKLIPFMLLSTLFLLIELGGVILLIIPAIIFGVWFAFSEYIFVSEEKGIIESLKSSKKIVSGKFWKILGRMFVFGLFSFVFQIVFSLLPYNIGSVASPLFGALFILPYYLLYKEIS